MDTKLNIFFASSGGNYQRMVPDFNEGKLIPTEDLICGKFFNLFGFMASVKAVGFGFSSELNVGLSEEEVRLKTFKNLIDLLQEEANKTGLQEVYILVKITQDHNCSTFWRLEADYHFLLRR